MKMNGITKKCVLNKGNVSDVLLLGKTILNKAL